MKNIPQPKDVPAQNSEAAADTVSEISAETAPLMPGTEQPRSLGDVLRDAETAQAAIVDPVVEGSNTAASNSPATEGQTRPAGGKRKRFKKVSRSQSRRFARERALQALYQWDVSGGQSSDVRKQFLDDQDMSRVDVDYFVVLFNGVSHKPQILDDALEDALDRPLSNLDPIERAVLRIATYELTQCLDIPARVVINEGIEITKRFGADKGHRYVNGVLDKLANAVRPLEMQKR